MADRVIEIIIETNDRTGGKLEGLKRSLISIDQAAQRARARLAAIGQSSYAATVRLIDRVTTPGSKINALLKSIASKTYSIAMKLNDGATNKLRTVEGALMRLASRSYNVAINLRDNVSGKLRGLTDGLLMGVGGLGAGMLGAAGVGYGAVNALQSYAAFEKQMSQVQAVRRLDKNSPEMLALVEQAKDLGMKTAWTRQQVGEAQYYEAMAGWDTNTILAATPAILNLASASNTDLGTTSDIMTDAMTGFLLNPQETYRDVNGRFVNVAKHFADIMTAVVTNSNTDVTQLGETLKYSSSIIGQMYADKDIQTRMHAVEDAMVIQGLMANAGVKGSQSGTSTRALFTRMSSDNRNAFFALQSLGIDFLDENHDVRRIRDIFSDLNKAFTQGMDVEKLMGVAEEFAGMKIHADTRRQLSSFMESVQQRGGEMSGADRLKMAKMLAGQEAMTGVIAAITGDWDKLAAAIDNAAGAADEASKIQLDNLAGSVTLLGSAWDAFQQSFFEGQAGEGLRSFVDTLTEIITRANNLFKDGIQIGDVAKIVGDVISRLKDKFLELDGVGSILAGGALVGGLMKIRSMAQGVMGMIRARTSGTSGTVSGGTSVGTMTVNANVVNLNGARAAGHPPTGTPPGTPPGSPPGSGSPPPPRPSRFAAFKAGAAISAAFAALDFLSTKSAGEEQRAAIAAKIEEAQRAHTQLIESGAEPEHIAQSLQGLNELRFEQAQVDSETAQLEREGLGAAGGSIIGGGLGAAIGTALGPVGTMVGGMLGALIGEALGVALADIDFMAYLNEAADVGAQINEYLTGLSEELTTGLGELMNSAGEEFNSLVESASNAMAAVGAEFDNGVAQIEVLWNELPGFFAGVLDGLGAIAAAAGNAIYSGLTSIIGSIIGAWNSAAATVSSILSSISAMASSAASFIPSFGGHSGGGSGSGFAEGGFVSSETHFFAGEHGPEVIIPLDPAKRARAFDLLDRTAAILNPLPAVDADVPISSSANSVQLELGGLNASFNIDGTKNPREVLESIRENLVELADKIGGQLAGTVLNAFNNMSPGGAS